MPDTIPTPTKPNVIIIMVDDLGFSDVGCYGGEINTPNIDALGTGGIRFTQMYNGARCCPSRAALLTGLHPHQAGIGQMGQNLGYPAYQGYLNQTSVTIAEVMGQSGYRTLMSGKWHVGGSYDARNRDQWNPGDETHPMPTQRGFDKYFGLLEAADSFWNPKSLTLQETLIKNESPDFHLTDAIAEHASNQIDESLEMGKPFFQYVAFTAPHWPLHAWEEDIAKYEGKYMQGWDAIRTSRHEEMKGLGIIDPKWPISARDEDSPPWESVENKEYEDIKMATYSAMVEQVDRGVGRIVDTLKAKGEFENTLIMFLSDNGGCAELFQEDDDWGEPSQWETEPTLEGLPIRVGNIPELRPARTPPSRPSSYPGPTCQIRRSDSSNAGSTKVASPLHSSPTGQTPSTPARFATNPCRSSTSQQPSTTSEMPPTHRSSATTTLPQLKAKASSPPSKRSHGRARSPSS